MCVFRPANCHPPYFVFLFCCLFVAGRLFDGLNLSAASRLRTNRVKLDFETSLVGHGPIEYVCALHAGVAVGFRGRSFPFNEVLEWTSKSSQRRCVYFPAISKHSNQSHTLIYNICFSCLLFLCLCIHTQGLQVVREGRDRKSGVQGKSVSVRVDPGVRRCFKKKKI